MWQKAETSPNWENNWEELLTRIDSIPDTPLLKCQDQNSSPKTDGWSHCLLGTERALGEDAKGLHRVWGSFVLSLPPFLVPGLLHHWILLLSWRGKMHPIFYLLNSLPNISTRCPWNLLKLKCLKVSALPDSPPLFSLLIPCLSWWLPKHALTNWEGE